MSLVPKHRLSPIFFQSKRLFLLPHQNPNLNHDSFSLSRHLCSSSTEQNPIPYLRGPTQLEKQFDSWVDRLKPGFSGDDLAAAVRSEPDPDLALDLFRWASLRPGYRHPPSAYLAALSAAVSSRRFAAAEALVDEILAGACPPDLPLLNAAARFCCSRRHLFSKAFDLFKKMQRRSNSDAGGNCRPNLETYSMLLSAVLRRIGKPPVAHVYLHAVRSLARQMKAAGIVPDVFALNQIIKAYSRCLEMDDAIRVFKEMGLYCCEPNEFSYGYIVKGLCEKGRLNQAMDFFGEMRKKGLVPGATVYMAVISSLALESRFEEAIEVTFDMLGNGSGKGPDLLTYRTLLEGLCREGRAEKAFELLDELSKKRGNMDRRMYTDLLDGLHWICQPQGQLGQSAGAQHQGTEII
ncbi:pentatricopeptide repeat-containing protein At3g25210, mitochondrial isoform X2 [Typha angustifolia]|uniref:pentatricopeptide repeat-containing protein At3g25210, mitochondrial isoform X2 n=1 Tax=Typha angustifolia TaxID=59011 RepID=UPI003C3094AD